jgi:hypothetical protein
VNISDQEINKLIHNISSALWDFSFDGDGDKKWLEVLEYIQWEYGVTFMVDRYLIDDFKASGNMKQIIQYLNKKKLELL